MAPESELPPDLTAQGHHSSEDDGDTQEALEVIQHLGLGNTDTDVARLSLETNWTASQDEDPHCKTTSMEDQHQNGRRRLALFIHYWSSNTIEATIHPAMKHM